MKRSTNQRLHELYIYIYIYRYTCRWRLVEPITQFVRAVPFRGALLEMFLFSPLPSPQKVANAERTRGERFIKWRAGKKIRGREGEGKVALLVEISNNFSSPFAGLVGWTRVSRPFSSSGRSPTPRRWQFSRVINGTDAPTFQSGL